MEAELTADRAKLAATSAGDCGAANSAAFAILLALSFSHLLNDTLQSVIQAIYPMLKASFHLSFGQIGLITLVYQLTASILQPVIGLYTDHRPKTHALAAGMTVSLLGLLLFAVAQHFAVLLAAAALVGIGSSVFHPEASRMARMASGGRHGLAQSLFQLGGTFGGALGPLLAAFIVIPHGQGSLAWLSAVALLAILVMTRLGRWYQRERSTPRTPSVPAGAAPLPRKVALSLAVLVLLMVSKFVYLASLGNYYTFYLIEKFKLPVETAQLYLFLFLAASAAGTLVGGPIGDRIGRKAVIWISILGVLPFTAMLPYAGLAWSGVLTVLIGLILASAFPAILVYAQELIPGRVGMVSGLFFGLAFGAGGIGAASLGRLADLAGIDAVFRLCAFLPALGLLTVFLPGPPRRN